MSRRDRRPHHTGKPLPPKPKLPTGKAPGEPPTKVELVRAAVATEDWSTALRIAKDLSGLGDDAVALSRAWEALVRPAFTREIGKDPDEVHAAGIAALRRRFS